MNQDFQFPDFGGTAFTASQWFEDAGVPAVLFWNGMEMAYTGESSSSGKRVRKESRLGKVRKHNPGKYQDLQFVVPDHLLDTAADALVRAGFQLCPRVHTCRLAQRRGQGPMPEDHFHNPDDHNEVLMLLEKSNFLWAVPEFPLDPVKLDDPLFMNSDDPRLESSKQNWPGSLGFSYRILTPGCLLESLLHLAARDRGTFWTYQECWIRELKWILFKYVKRGKSIRKCQVTPLMWPFVLQLLEIKEEGEFEDKLDLVLKDLQQALYDNDVISPMPGVLDSVLLDD